MASPKITEMPALTILTETELKEILQIDDEVVVCIEDSFRDLARGRVVLPPILHMEMPQANGELDIKTAYMPGMDCFAVKLAPGFFDNPKRGLPSLNGLMVALNAETGLVETLLLDNGYLTNLRTAAAGAVAAKWLAREDASQIGILGAGVQAQMQLQALPLVRPVEGALLWARDMQKAKVCADALTELCKFPVNPCSDIDAVAASCDILVTTTATTTPLIEASQLKPGLHITAVGAGAPHKNEIAADALAAVDVYICDRQEQCALLGELHHALDAGVVKPDRRFGELGEVISGDMPGRMRDEAITLCDLTGIGTQDTAIVDLVRRRAKAVGAGTSIVT